MDSTYITSAAKAQQLPEPSLPEVAFIGRSNCGKSSLLNALLNRTNLARTSSTPGRTQMVNFFGLKLGERRLVFADLPGYGYAAAGRETRKPWQQLIETYLKRPSVREYLFLIDARRAANLDEDDQHLIRYLTQRPNGNAALTVVLTKADKLNQKEQAQARMCVEAALKALQAGNTRLITVSSLKKKGIDPLRQSLLAYMEAAPDDDWNSYKAQP